MTAEPHIDPRLGRCLLRFSTDKPVSFSDFNGDAIFSSTGLEIGLGYSRSTMRFVQAGKNRSIAPAPKAQWSWGVSTGGLACGPAELHGTLKMLHVPMWRSRWRRCSR
jgi:hypothetical protein